MESTVYCQEHQCEKNATYYVSSEGRYVWSDHKNSQYAMEEANGIIDPKNVRSILQTFSVSLEILQIFSQDHKNEFNQQKVKDLCHYMEDEYFYIN